MEKSPQFMIFSIEGELDVSQFSDRTWIVRFPGGERDDILVSELAVSAFRDPYVKAAVEAVIAFEQYKTTGKDGPARMLED